MKRIVDADMEISCKKFNTAVKRFFNKYPELKEWKETFEYMHENNEDFFSDTLLSNGEKNKNWCYALHLDEYDGHFYIAVIERM